jgi:hypothetical protein
MTAKDEAAGDMFSTPKAAPTASKRAKIVMQQVLS